MSVLRLVLASAALLATAAGPAAAQLLCVEPVEPTCVGEDSTYRGEAQVKRCRQDVERYVSQADEYRTCLEEALQDAAAAAEELEQRFECRAQGQGNCP